jgi:antitoxin component YwqK of YwqJK toxin-antitoxin module
MIRITNLFLPLLLLAVLAISCNEKLIEKTTQAYADGSPMIVQYFRPGDTSGNVVKEVQYYKNKQKKLEGFFADNQRHGEWTFWFANGQIWSHGYFDKGLRVGKTVVNFENGQVFYTGEYINGQKHGTWQFYNEAGNPTQKMIFEEGKLINQENTSSQKQ